MTVPRHQHAAGPAPARRWAIGLGVLLAAAVVMGGVMVGRAGTAPPPTPAAATTDVPGVITSAAVEQAVEGAGNKGPTVTLGTLAALAPGTSLSAVGLTYGGATRSYLVISPARRSGPLPLVVMLAGGQSSPTFQATRDSLFELAQAGRAVIVYPTQTDSGWNVQALGCCGVAGATQVDDSGFVQAVVARARRTLDTDRTYLAGYSNGGKLAWDLACATPTLFAAVTTSGATPLVPCANRSQPPLSVQFLVGAKDPELPISPGKPAATALADAEATWRARNDCAATPTVRTVGTATVTTWTCADGTRVRGVYYSALDHLWPAAAQVGSAADGESMLADFVGL